MSVRPSDEGEPVAIIGLGCRFPGAEGPVAFWSLIERGGDSVGTPPPDRQVAGAPATRGGFLERIDHFDARFFGISPREAERLDPQQRMLLEVTSEALDYAGLSSRALDGSTAGVFVGMWINDYEARMFAETGRVDFHMTTGSGRYTASGRLSHLLGLRGPSVTVDTACSSSLVAVHLACQSIWSGESDIALAAGVNVILQPHITAAYSQAGMLSGDGRCKFGDAHADGYVRSEGVGVVVLKRLSRARADRDPIHAVILGSAVNNDGHTGGSLGTPGREGQEDLLRKAYRRAGVRPAAVGYVEAHGTGTRAGDPVELGALGTILGEERPADRPCLVGSVKTNIGHTEGAAGIAGLIKVVLALQHGIIPASLHCETPTPEVAWDRTHLRIATCAAPWPAGSRRIAGVSSFGIGGTNAHVVLAAAEDDAGVGESAAARMPGSGTETLLPLSARSADALRAQARRHAEYLAGPAAAPLADVVYTAALRRTHHPERLAVVGRDHMDIARRLATFAETGSAVGVVQGSGAQASHVVFVFPGQGSQWVGMGRGLLEAERAGDVSGRDLAHAVAHHRVRLDTPGTPQGREPDLNRKQGRLQDVDFVQPGLGRIGGGELREQRPISVGPNCTVTAFHGLAEHRFLLQERSPHAKPLGPLPGKHEDRLSPAIGRLAAGRQPGTDLSTRDRLKPLCHFCRGLARHGQAVLVMTTPHAGRVANVEGCRRRLRIREEILVPSRERLQGRRAARRQRQEVRGPGTAIFGHPLRSHHLRVGAGSLARDDMGVGSTKTKRAYPGQGCTGVRGPRTQRRAYSQRESIEGNVGVGRLEMQAGWDLSMPQRQCHLDQSSDSGRRLEVTQVRLDRTKETVVVGKAVLGKHRTEGLCLDWIAQERAGAMGFDVLNVAGRDSGSPVGLSEDLLLGKRIRRHQSVAASVLVHCAAFDDGVNRIAVDQGS